MPKLLDLMEAGDFRPQLITSALAGWDEADEALLRPETKLVIERDSDADGSRSPR